MTLPTLADDQLMATDKSVGFISAIEEQVVNNEQLAQGSDVIYEGVTGTVEQITVSPTVQALAAAVEQPSKIIVVKFPDGGKVAGTVTISVYGDNTWSMDGDIEFEVFGQYGGGYSTR